MMNTRERKIYFPGISICERLVASKEKTGKNETQKFDTKASSIGRKKNK
jgi:hypothetical protein